MGNDTTGDGSPGNPWQTINKGVSVLPKPVIEETTFELVGTLANPQEYAAATLTGVVCIAGAHVNIQPVIWNQDNYEGGYDPFAAAGQGTLNTLGAKPCKIVSSIGPAVTIEAGSTDIRLRGLECSGSTLVPIVAAVSIADRCKADLHYCRVTESPNGVKGAHQSLVLFENGYISALSYGLYVFNQCQLTLSGDNCLSDCGACGVLVYASDLKIKPQDDLVRQRFTTTIETLSPRLNYKAIWARCNSTVIIVDLTDVLNFAVIGYVKILNKNLYQSDEYYGVVLEERSLLVNSKHITFSDPTINEGRPTVPEGKQIVMASQQGCVEIE